MEVSGQLHDPAALPSGKEPLVRGLLERTIKKITCRGWGKPRNPLNRMASGPTDFLFPKYIMLQKIYFTSFHSDIQKEFEPRIPPHIWQWSLLFPANVLFVLAGLSVSDTRSTCHIKFPDLINWDSESDLPTVICLVLNTFDAQYNFNPELTYSTLC